MVTAWDEEAGELRPQRVRTTVGRIIFNQIVPDRLRFTELTNREMRRTDLKRLVDECYRLLGPADTAHLVDGIKDVGFKFATRGGMTIGLWDIVTPPAEGEGAQGRRRARSATSTSSSSAASSPRRSATSRSSSSGSARPTASRPR